MSDLEAILAIDQNRVHFEAVVSLVRKGAIDPFIGAGLTSSCGFPVWGEFLRECALKAGVTEQVASLLKKGAYIEAADVVEGILGNSLLDQQISARFGKDASDLARICGPILYLPSIASGPVFTTNFDQVIERVFREAHEAFERVVESWEKPTIRGALHERKRVLVKLHGDAENEATRVFTGAEYNARYGQSVDGTPQPLPAVLTRIFGRPMLFLGCGLERDRSLSILQQETDEELAPYHFAVVEDKGNALERARYLAELRIKPIWYPAGRHEVVDLLLAELVRRTSGSESVSSSKRRARWRAGAATVLTLGATMILVSMGRSESLDPIPGYSPFADVDWPGGDLVVSAFAQSEGQVSPQSCARECDTRSDCVGFVSGSGKDSGWCWLKGSMGFAKGNPRRVTYMRNANSSLADYEVTVDTDYPDNVLENLSNVSASECASVCEQNKENCAGFVMKHGPVPIGSYVGSGSCQLKNFIGTRASASNAVSYCAKSRFQHGCRK
jgi:hypothetical protein